MGLAELPERVRGPGRPVVQAHRLLRDDVDADHAEPAGSHPAERVHRDPVLALLRREEQDELALAPRVLDRCGEGDRGLPRARGGVGEEVLPLPDRTDGVREERALPVPNRLEGERGGDPGVERLRPSAHGRIRRLQRRPILRRVPSARGHPCFPGGWPKVLALDNRVGTVKYASPAWSAGWRGSAPCAGSKRRRRSARGAGRSSCRVRRSARSAGRSSRGRSRCATRAEGAY